MKNLDRGRKPIVLPMLLVLSNFFFSYLLFPPTGPRDASGSTQINLDITTADDLKWAGLVANGDF